MRVLIAVGHPGIHSGASFQARNQLFGLQKAGMDVAACWGADEMGDGSCFDEIKNRSIPLFKLPIHKKPTLDSLRAFRQMVREFGPDVIECFKSGAQYHALYSSIGMRKHAIVFYRGVSREMDLFMGLKYRLKRVDRVIANCNALKEIMSRTGHIPADKIDVVYGEFVLLNNDPEKVRTKGLRKELGIPRSAPLLTQLGNWSTWRGQDITIKAAAKLRDMGVRFHLLFCGHNTDKLQPIVDEFRLNKLVTLSPFRTDPERVLKITDIAVNSSTSHESLNGSLINAQVMGLPAVSSALAGAGEIITEGETGYVVPVGDVEALTEALGKMLTLDSISIRSMRSKARKHALSVFSSEARTNKRITVYERAIDHRKSVIGH